MRKCQLIRAAYIVQLLLHPLSLKKERRKMRHWHRTFRPDCRVLQLVYVIARKLATPKEELHPPFGVLAFSWEIGVDPGSGLDHVIRHGPLWLKIEIHIDWKNMAQSALGRKWESNMGRVLKRWPTTSLCLSFFSLSHSFHALFARGPFFTNRYAKLGFDSFYPSCVALRKCQPDRTRLLQSLMRAQHRNLRVAMKKITPCPKTKQSFRGCRGLCP